MGFARLFATASLCLTVLCTFIPEPVDQQEISSAPARARARADCPKPLPDGQTAGEVYNITTESGDRWYLISIPPSYQPGTAAPLIFSYHGGLRNATEQLALDQLTNTDINPDSFVVHPQGAGNTWQGVPGVTTDDVQFTIDILNDVECLYCIDSTRIWVTGKSDGGGFCNILACNPTTSKRIAAFAPVSGAYYIDTLPCRPSTVEIPCSPNRTDIPFLAFHGGQDGTIPYNGRKQKGECLPAIPHFIRQWAGRDEMSMKNVTTELTSDTVIYSFGQRSDAGLVELVYDSAIGHDWPSTQPNDDNTRKGHQPASFDATPMILDFFKKHPPMD